MKIYTHKYEPFMMGGNLRRPIATEIEDYEKVNLGKGYFGILIKNPEQEKWHMCLEGCGAMIGTDDDKQTLVTNIITDMATGDEEVMKEQFAKALNELKNAEVMENERFFRMFK